MPDPCDYCDCDDVDQGTHTLTCINNTLDAPDPPDYEEHPFDLENMNFWSAVSLIRDKAIDLHEHTPEYLDAFLEVLAACYNAADPDNNYDLDIG